MSRSYSFEHFTAARPAVSPWKRASAHEKESMGREPLPLRYGHPHARTEVLYQRHREEHERQATLRSPEMKQETQSVETPPPSQASETPSTELFSREGIEELGQLALDSVRRAAREASRGRALRGVRRLAEDTVSGTLKVMRAASERMSRLASDLSAEQARKLRPDR